MCWDGGVSGGLSVRGGVYILLVVVYSVSGGWGCSGLYGRGGENEVVKGLYFLVFSFEI